MVFKLRLTHTPYMTTSQDSMQKYISTADIENYENEFYVGAEVSDREHRAQSRKLGQTHMKKTQMTDMNIEENFEHKERIGT